MRLEIALHLLYESKSSNKRVEINLNADMPNEHLFGRVLALGFFWALLSVDACSAPLDTTEDSVAEQQARTARKTFMIDIPTSGEFSIDSVGPVEGQPHSVHISAVNKEETVQLNVLVLPGLKGYETVKKMAAGWEKGLMKNLTRKESSRFKAPAGKPAYGLVASVVGPDDKTYFARSILIVAGGRNYMIAVTYEKGLGGMKEVDSFINSFRLRK